MNKKELIIRAALELLVENGIHATPMSAIAKHAGTGMGTIYNYFKTKNDLINAIYVIVKQEEEVFLSSIDSQKPIKTQFEYYYSRMINFYIQNPLYFKFIEQLQASPIITQETKSEGFKAINKVINLIEKGQKERILKNIQLSEILQFTAGTIISYMRWYFNREETKKKIGIENHLKMVWDAIKE